MKMRKLRVSLYGGGLRFGGASKGLLFGGTPKGAYGDGLTHLMGSAPDGAYGEHLF